MSKLYGFSKDELYVSKFGTMPFYVIGTNWRYNRLSVKYLHNGRVSSIPKDNIVKYNRYDVQDQTNEKERGNIMKTLYEVNGDFAYKIGETSTGLWVMEFKNSGLTLAIDKNDCVKVVPYTITVKNVFTGKEVDFRAKKDSVNIGQMFILSNSHIVAVTKLDTAKDGVQAEFKPIREILTVEVKEGKV